MKKASFIVLVLLLAGCGSSLDRTFTNFTAYYNTFYNAKQDFKAGIAKVEEQPVEINPDKPVLPHSKPPPAGEQDFENAVDNAAQILRRFADSKWTDNALLLMGKSYYYLQEYFLARQKFEELLALSSPSSLKQKAVIWKARMLLGIKAYSQGIPFLEQQLAEPGLKWTSTNKAEARILLAEHHAMMGNWNTTAAILEPAVFNVESQPLRGRSYFLLGQSFQQLNKLTLAYQAFSNVKRNFLDYEYIQEAEIKKAAIARMQGKVKLAVLLYLNMLQDAKNAERRNEINYQLAQTYHAADKLVRAEEVYQQILRNRDGTSGGLRADTYYQLGQLYSRQYQDYELAAAYFDSSSFQAGRQPGGEADRLASAYNRYLSLRQTISRADSLLALGTLSETKLNIRLAEVRKQRQEMLTRTQNEVQQTNNVLSNVRAEDIYNNSEPPAATSGFGFLNYKNSKMVRGERRQFRAVWGDRSLVDNWRRAEALSGTNISETEEPAKDSASIANQPITPDGDRLGIDVSEIPRTPNEKEALRQEVRNARYRLGSLFFLTLQQPDSAAYYYQQLLQDSISTELRAQTLYSLYELYNMQQRPDSTAKYRSLVLANHANTLYAKRIVDEVASSEPEGKYLITDSTARLHKQVQKLMEQDSTGKPNQIRAQKLYQLAKGNRSSPLAPAIFFESIRESIQYAKFRDRRKPADSSSAEPPHTFKTQSYNGTYWDRVRGLITEFKSIFPKASQIEQVEVWNSMLNDPIRFQAISSCKELGVEPAIAPSEKAFLETVMLPENVRGMNLSGTIRYRITITQKGRVSSYKLLSKPTKLGIEEAYNQAIEQSLRFEPVQQNGHAVRVSCEVEFPISQ